MATLRQQIDLLRGLWNKELAYTDPFYVTLDVTRRCNLTCVGCRYHSTMLEHSSLEHNTPTDFPFDLFVRVCNELQAMSTKQLILIGEGEPFLNRRLFDMVSLAEGAGLFVELLTNGTLLNQANCNSLIDCGLDRLKVSLWATSQEEYEQNYPGTDPACFGRAVEGLERLGRIKAERNRSRPHVVLHHPINRHNHRKIDGVMGLARRTGCNGVSFSPFKTRRGELSAVALSKKEEGALRHSLARLRGELESLSMDHNIDNTLVRYRIGDAVWEKLPCYIGWLQVRIRIDGTVFPCEPCDMPMGNLRENTLREIWNSVEMRQFRRTVMTRKGLADLNNQCDCGFCCHAGDNARVHRLFRWMAPFVIRHGN